MGVSMATGIASAAAAQHNQLGQGSSASKGGLLFEAGVAGVVWWMFAAAVCAVAVATAIVCEYGGCFRGT
jgi:hypothetical protein